MFDEVRREAAKYEAQRAVVAPPPDMSPQVDDLPF